ncbi:hypothetical protein C7M84_010827 [Penaeus vannamei]|uniref:Uncharacterized protein n=1 Tax=Penaeus vannamei TaxID=6689 RepID=A0A3R7M9M5_PENVA|nr:hypothetical protein C7M84_010827 [Penaeus vannamei]
MLVPADDYYDAERELYTSIVQSASTAMSLIIDKYICLANGLAAPDTDIEDCFGGKNKKKQSLVKYLEDHEPNETTFSQTRTHSLKPQPALQPKICTEEDIQREVQETLQRRKSQLGLPDDYEVQEVQDTELDLESGSDLSEVEDEGDIKDERQKTLVKIEQRLGKHVVVFHFSFLGGRDIDAQVDASCSDTRETPTCPTLKDGDLEMQNSETEPHLHEKKQKPKIRRVLLSNGRIVFKYKMDSEKEMCSQDLPPESLKWSSMIARNSTVELSSIMEDTTVSVIHPMGKMNDRARKQEGGGPGVTQKWKMLPLPEHSTQEARKGIQQNPSQTFVKPQVFPHDANDFKKVNRRNAEESLREAEQSKLLQLYNVKKPMTSVTEQMEQSSSSDEETTLLTVESSSRVVGPFHSSLTTAIKLREQLRDTSDQAVQVNRPTAVSAADSNLQNESAVRRTTKSFWELDDSDDSLPRQTFKATSRPEKQRHISHDPARGQKHLTSMEQSSHSYSILGNLKWPKRKEEKVNIKKPRLMLPSNSLRMGKEQMK